MESSNGSTTTMEGKKKERKGHSHRLTCFHPPPPPTNVPRQLDWSSEAVPNGASTPASHLVVMVNGIIGSAGNWRFAAKQLVKRFPENVIVRRSRCNYHTLTFDGVDVMGERLAKEVLSVIELLPGLKRISFVAHSLGGLIARYAIARLYTESINEDCEKGGSDDSDFRTWCLKGGSKGKIAGLEPVNFITFATPHMGSRWHKQVPMFCGSRTWEKLAVQASWVLGRTGRHLFLSDKDVGQPLLLRMADDTTDLKFISALQSFDRRVVYSNACSDNIVGWQTSSIRRRAECPKREEFIEHIKYPHVVHIEIPQRTSTHEKIGANGEVDGIDMEEAIIQGLNRVSWERVDISFRKSKQRVLAHTTIQVKTYFLNSDGADVINHMMDNFVL